MTESFGVSFIFFFFFFFFPLFFFFAPILFLVCSSLLFSSDDGLSIHGDGGAVCSVEEQNPQSSLCLSAYLPVSLVASASQDRAVRIYSVLEGGKIEYLSEVCKFTTNALCVDLIKDTLACGAEDGSVRVFSVQDSTAAQLTASRTFSSAVVSVALDPKLEYLIVVLAVGTAHLLKLQGDLPQVAVLLGKVAVTKSDLSKGQEPVPNMAWNPSGSELAVACSKGQVLVFSRSAVVASKTWNPLRTFACGSENQSVTSVAYSCNGAYLACCVGNDVQVWSLASSSKVNSVTLSSGIGLRLRWSPFGNVLCAVTGNGSAHLLEDIIPSHLPTPHMFVELSIEQELFADDFDEDAELLAAAEQAERNAAAQKSSSNAAAVSASSSAPSSTAAAASLSVLTTPQPKKLQRKSSSMMIDDVDVVIPEDDGVDDLFDTPHVPTSAPVNAAAVALAASKAVDESLASKLEELVRKFRLREAASSFHPSATMSGGSNRRLLVWNRVGRAVCVDDRTESIVEVEFADISAHRKIRVADLYSYSMGSLSEAGVVLAAVAAPDAGTRAVVHFKPVVGLVGGAEWQELMEAGDDVLGVAVGDDWIAAVVAPFMYLRIWSVSGLQTLPLQLPISKFVSMVGQGSRLSIVHDVPGGGQHVLVYDLALKRLIFNVALPVTPGGVLTWCGYTTTGVLVSLDSAGVGRALLNTGDWAGQWVPLLHPEGPLDLSRKWPLGWPIGCTDDSLIVVRLNEEEEVETGLILDDDNRGAPSIDTVRWNAPLVAPNSALSVGLEPVLRRRMLQNQSAEPNPRRELEIDSEIVKLIALAAKNAMPQRALELFRQLRANQTRLVAMKWVGANGYDQLFSKMEADYRAANASVLDDSGMGQDEDDDEAQEQQQHQHQQQHHRSDSSKKRASFSDEVLDESSNHPTITTKKAKAKTSSGGGKATNPFSAKVASSVSIRRSSSGGVLEQLARIESKTKK